MNLKKFWVNCSCEPIEKHFSYILFQDQSYFSQRYLDIRYERLSSFEEAVNYLNRELDIIIAEGTMDWDRPYFIIITDDDRLFRKYKLVETTEEFMQRDYYLTRDIFNTFERFIKTDYKHAYIPIEKEMWNCDDGNSYEIELEQNWKFI